MVSPEFDIKRLAKRQAEETKAQINSVCP